MPRPEIVRPGQAFGISGTPSRIRPRSESDLETEGDAQSARV